MCVGNCIDSDRDRFTAKGVLYTDTVSYAIDTVSYGSSGKMGLTALCSVWPPVSNVGVLCCSTTRTVLSVLSHTLYNLKDPFQ